MSTFYLQLLTIPTSRDIPDTARAYIALKISSEEKVGEDTFTTISAECRTLQEVEKTTELLIKDLKAIKKQAAKFFKRD